MKYIWEEDDIKVGRYYYKGDKGGSSEPELSYLASTTHKIGFLSFEVNGAYVAISITDGMVGREYASKDFADMLNRGEYIPIRTERLVEIIAFLEKQNSGV